MAHRFRLTTLWLVLFAGMLAGLGLARVGPGPGPAPVLMLLIGILLMRCRGIAKLALVLLLGVTAGWLRGEMYISKLSTYQPLYYQKITLTVQAAEDATYDKYGQLGFLARNIRLADGDRLTGSIRLSGFGMSMVYDSDEVVASGKLYPGYGSQQGRMSYAQMQVTGRHPTWLTDLRASFVAGTATALPEPHASFVMGLLVGQRSNLPEDTRHDLQAVGLTHIIAASGANLTIIVQAAGRLLKNRSKRLNTGFSLALVGVFLMLTGGHAPIVRAAIVSVLSIVAGYYGRSFKPLNLIALAAAVTAMVNPVYIWSDIGWYLSFLAFYGVLVLAPLLRGRLAGKWHKTIIGGVALETICAEIMTLPLALYVFGQMSRVGLLANVLVVSMIPLAMLLGTVAGLGGMLLPALAGWFAWPAAGILSYMLSVAALLADLPNAFVKGIGLSLGQMIILYGCVAWLSLVLWYRNPRKNAIITDITDPTYRGVMT